MELFNRVREGLVTEAATAYRKLTEEEAALYHKAVGLYQVHPGAMFVVGLALGFVLKWAL